jgi:LysR family glycine cleavage system transcriptional activator
VAVYPVDPDMAVSGTVRVLARNNLTPVAAPRIAASIAGPADLAGANLIHDLAWKGDWARWLAAFGVGGVDSGRGPTHSLYAIAVERCVAGDGVLIGHTALIGQHLADGRLQALFPKQALPGLPLCLLAGSEKSRDPDLAAAIEALACA